MLALLGVAMYIVKYAGVESVLNTEWLDTYIRGKGWTGKLAYIGLATLFIGVGVPRQLVCFLGGYSFGLIYGTIFAIIGSGLSCFLVTLYARLFGKNMIYRRYSTQIKKVDAFLCKKTFFMAIAIRFLPVGNNLVTNLVFGVSSSSIFLFVTGSIIGYFPQTFIFTLLGSGFNVTSVTHIVIAIALFVISSVIGIIIYYENRLNLKTLKAEA